MSLLVLALIPPALFAASNYLDKYLLSTYFKDQGVGGLLIFSSLIGVLALPFILLFSDGVLSIPASAILLTAVNGMIAVLALLPYFYALNDDDASVVAPLWQLIPVFGYVLGYVFLGETLTVGQLLAGGVIFLGACALSLELGSARFMLKWRTLLLMSVASALMAVNGVLFKLFALEASYWVTSFWTYVGLVAIGVLLFALVPSYRQQFLMVFRENSHRILSLNALNEVINTTGMFIVNFALLLAPVTLIFLANAAQPFFVFAFGILLTLALPRVLSEGLDRRTLVHKGISIATMFVGAYLLHLAS